jgi:hypothetical protein
MLSEGAGSIMWGFIQVSPGIIPRDMVISLLSFVILPRSRV